MSDQCNYGLLMAIPDGLGELRPFIGRDSSLSAIVLDTFVIPTLLFWLFDAAKVIGEDK
ncbi:hypothetical protein [Nostoc sp. UHCC 0252]|uniref:hypothetical protein n=1 Tax=Nostoc sp. UHCC 0252 TaxID=3110241 RepID=UPI002B1F0CFA|nr:hypothetical protein [Nostoc sp. UHCC 0252]MEA5601360.1 hypothetical protein [Nostoc sp. UHCC 0252]